MITTVRQVFDAIYGSDGAFELQDLLDQTGGSLEAVSRAVVFLSAGGVVTEASSEGWIVLAPTHTTATEALGTLGAAASLDSDAETLDLGDLAHKADSLAKRYTAMLANRETQV